MKLNEFVSACYGNCYFPARLNRAAIEYYRDNSENTACYFFLAEMVRKNDYTLCTDDIRFITEGASVALPELFEAFLYASLEDFRRNKMKPKTLIIVLPEDN